MNPMLLADWGRIHRMFRAVMWLAVIVLACVVVTFASPHASGAPSHSTPRHAGKVAAPSWGTAELSARHSAQP